MFFYSDDDSEHKPVESFVLLMDKHVDGAMDVPSLHKGIGTAQELPIPTIS